MKQLKSMQMEMFGGGADPIAADNWRRKLEKNFLSARCPPEYRRDLATHHLKDDALVWWDCVVEGARDQPELTWEDFLEEFNNKYFPREAMDKMEGRFQDINQGSRDVRKYGEEFNQLRRFAGRHMTEKELIRRFMKGLRIEIKNSCNVREFRTLNELVEKAGEQEAGIEEQRKQNQATRAAKRPRETSAPSDSGTARTPCAECGRMHYGECKGPGCFKCGQLGYIKRNCPQLNDGTVTKTPNTTCQLCGRYGHAARECRDWTEAGTGAALPAPPPKKPATLPRVFVAGNNQGTETIVGN